MRCFSRLVSVPVDGKWGVWGKWTTCSKTCGGGYMSRSRTCNNPAPQNGGRPCQGPSSERTSCNDQKCPGRRCIDLIVIVCAVVSHSACQVGVKGGEVSNFQNLGEFYEHTSCSIKDYIIQLVKGGEDRWIFIPSQALQDSIASPSSLPLQLSFFYSPLFTLLGTNVPPPSPIEDYVIPQKSSHPLPLAIKKLLSRPLSK